MKKGTHNSNNESWLDDLVLSPISNADELALEIGVNVTEARLVARMTQEQLAKRMGTLQPSIARVESGSTLPSLPFLLRIAKALRTNIVAPTFQSIVRERETVKHVTYHFPPLSVFKRNNSYQGMIVSSLSVNALVSA
ncbi:MAG: helix-turn-helix transcriptional regulator [Patescibacteria group bacterium]